MTYRLEEVPGLVHLLYNPPAAAYEATDRGASHNINPVDLEAQRIDIERAWSRLPMEGYEKVMLYLVCVDGCTVNEAAEGLGLYHGKAKRALTRGLQRLHELLNGSST